MAGSQHPIRRCNDAPAEALLRGIEQFNRREYFECHETLEALWLAERAEARAALGSATYGARTAPLPPDGGAYCDQLYKGILQVGVGCYHLLRGNYRGAVLKLRAGADYLAPFAPRCMGVEVAALIADAHRLLDAVLALGPERLGEVDLALLPVIHSAVPDAPDGHGA
jgi:predicted metal-dependent hydrolase